MAKPSKYKYYEAATVKDELDGSVYTLGSTVETLSVEISGNTHPFYTGQETLVDTAGRIDKFNARIAAANGKTKADKVRSKKSKQKQSLADIMKAEQSQPKPKSKKKEEPKTEKEIVAE